MNDCKARFGGLCLFYGKTVFSYLLKNKANMNNNYKFAIQGAAFITLLICIIIALATYVFLSRNKAGGQDTETIVIDTVFIHKTDTIIFSKPEPVYVFAPVIPPAVDTASIINDYYSKKIYSEILINTENLKLSLSDTILQNTILGRNLSYELTFPEITKTVTITKKPVFSTSLLLDSRSSASLVFGYKHFFLQGGYNLQHKEPFVGFGVKLYER